MKVIFLLSLFFCSLVFSAVPNKNDAHEYCHSSKEYITTVQYLRDKKEYGLSEKEILDAADEVSKGCINASQRFINTTRVLTKLGVDTRFTIKTALKFASKTDLHSQTFIEIFKYAYNPDKLDLDVYNAIEIALKLSIELDGNLQFAVENYKELVSFCVKNKSLELPLPECAKLASDLSLQAKNFDRPMAKDFKKLTYFLKEDKKGPGLSLKESIDISKKVIANGPTATENFQQAFQFASAKMGLKLSHQDALKFAQKMTERSTKMNN